MNDFVPPPPNPYEPPALEPDAAEEAGIVPRPVAGPRHPVVAILLDETNRPRTIWRFMIFGAAFFLFQMLLIIPILIIAAVYVLAVGRVTTDDGDAIFREILGLLESPLEITALAALPVTLSTFLLVLACRRLIDRRPIAWMGFVSPRLGPASNPLVGLLLGGLLILLAGGAAWLMGGYRLEGYGLPGMILLIVPALVLMAFYEEIVFRGYLLQNLLEVRQPLFEMIYESLPLSPAARRGLIAWTPAVFGILFTSLGFWVMHGANPSAWSSPLVGVNLFGAGVVLALAYMVSRNIWFPSLLHFAWNFTQGIVLSIPISGMRVEGFVRLAAVKSAPSWIHGGPFGLEASLLTTLVEILASACFLAVLYAQWRRGAGLAGAKPEAVDCE